jgi:hypothetical protein
MARGSSLAALTALVASVVVGCGGTQTSDAVGGPVSFAQLSKAATASVDAGTGRFEFTMQMSFPGAGEPLSFKGTGAFDSSAKRSSLELDLSSFAKLLGGAFAGGASDAPSFDDPALWRVEVVQDGVVMYMRFPALAGQLPAGTSWVRADLRQLGQAKGFDLEQLQELTGSDPRKMLDYLRAVSGDIETVGVEQLRGVETTHYHATVDLLRYEKLVPAAKRKELKTLLGDVVEQSGLRELPVDVWLDGFGLVRKLQMRFSATQPGLTEPAEAALGFELYDYGKRIVIELPPASDVVDISSLRG